MILEKVIKCFIRSNEPSGGTSGLKAFPFSWGKESTGSGGQVRGSGRQHCRSVSLPSFASFTLVSVLFLPLP